MIHFIFVTILSLFLTTLGYAKDVSLIDDEDVSEIEVEQSESLSLIDETHDDEFEEMDDFIQIENEKLKDIKLLNLDLERVSLELKKKEVEQKMALLNKGEQDADTTSDGIDGEEGFLRPVVKMLGIFESDSNKQVILSINGNHVTMKEGEEVEGVGVKFIGAKRVTVQYRDGQVKEIFIS